MSLSILGMQILKKLKILRKNKQDKGDIVLNSFYALLDTIEFFFHLPEFKIIVDNSIALNEPQIAFTYEKQQINPLDLCSIKFLISNKNLFLNYKKFFKKFFNVLFSWSERYAFRIDFMIIYNKSPKTTNIEYKKICLRVALLQKEQKNYYFPVFKVIDNKDISIPIPSSLNEKVHQIMQEINEISKNPQTKKFKHIFFIQKFIQFLKDKEIVPEIKNLWLQEEEKNKDIKKIEEFITGLNRFLQDLYNQDLSLFIEKIQAIQKQDKIFLQVKNITDYNRLITTHSCRQLLQLLINIIQKLKFEIQLVNHALGHVKFLIKLPPFTLNDKLQKILPKFLGSSFKPWLKKFQHFQNSVLNIDFAVNSNSIDSNSVIWGIELIPNINDPYTITHTIKFAFNQVNPFKDMVQQALKKQHLGDINFISEFLSILKKGNIFEFVNNDEFVSDLKELNAIELYSQIYNFQNYIQDLQEFFSEILKQNSLSVDLNITPNTLPQILETFNKIENEAFEKVWLEENTPLV